MGGFDDHGSLIGDWVLPSPSPRSFFSSMLGDDGIGLGSISEPKCDTKSEFVFPALDGQNGPENAYTSDKGLATSAADESTNNKSGPFSEQKMGSRGGLLERMAARAGFNAPRLNTDSIRPAGISQISDVRSPYLTIPPGLSPTTLLDSPVFLSNSLVQPSPTTGKFQFAPNGNSKSSMFSESLDKSKENYFENMNRSPFAFQTVANSALDSRDAVNKVTPSFLACRPSPNIGDPVQSDNSFPPGSLESVKLHSLNGTTVQRLSEFSKVAPENIAEGNNVFSQDMQLSAAVGSAENSPPLDDQQDDISDANGNNAPSEDGYNWRKYGQKQVKGSDYPRSYFKCTHPNCPVKKKVERSQEGHITEIIYKGAHNHVKPLHNRRAGFGSSNALADMQVDITEQSGIVVNGDQVWMQKGTTDWRQDNLEVASSAQVAPLQTQNGSQFESSDAVDVSSTFSNEEEEEDRATHGSISLGYDGEGDESESKRRKVETYAGDVSGNTRAIREPRVVVQTTSEVDILDDGYRWRKYGQKVVKGNPNPRSYYKCTNAGCTVRKHVERASHDLKSVITTYEGKHNHDVPAARNSSHSNSSVPNNTMTLQSQVGQSQVNRPDPSYLQLQNMSRFERPPQSLIGSYGLAGRQQFGPSFGFGSNYQNQQPTLGNMAMAAGLGANQVKMPSVLPNHQFFGQPRQMNQMGFMLPKGEPKVEPMSEPRGLNPASSSSSSAVYQQMMMNRMPLGPLGPQM